MNRKPLAYDPCPEDFARWGYAEGVKVERIVSQEELQSAADIAFKDGFANGNAEGEANGKVIGYDLAVAELKARDAKLVKLLDEMEDTMRGFEDCIAVSDMNNAIIQAQSLLEKEAKTI